MVWSRLVSGLTAGRTGDAAATFLAQLIPLVRDLPGPPDPHVMAPTLAQRIWQAEWHGQATGGAAAEDAGAFERLRRELVRRFPSADVLALRWLCDVPGLWAWCERARKQAEAPYAPGPYFDVADVLALWVQRHPGRGAADAALAALSEHVRVLTHGDGAERVTPRAAIGLVETLARLEEAQAPGALPRCRTLLAAVVRAAAEAPASAATAPSAIRQLLFTVATVYGPRLAGAGLLGGEELDGLLLAVPTLPNNVRQPRWPGLTPPRPPAAWHAEVAAAIDRLLARSLAGDRDPRLRDVLRFYQAYAGIDHFLAAGRALEQRSGAKPLEHSWRNAWSDDDPLAWAVPLLCQIAPPGAADAARAADLAALRPATLLAAAIYAPSWAGLLAPHLSWPGLGAMLQWLRRNSGLALWSAYRRPAPEDEEGAGPGAVDRAAALEAVEQMGEERVRRLIGHRLARSLYGDGIFYLQAVLGWNAADVEAGFLKRTKRAVRALGMLPDEGDVRERYLALRRFAKESRQFGAQRQASEELAAESGLANLAVTAGYQDLAQLEWAMEAQIAREVDPAARRWTVGDYTVWVEAGGADGTVAVVAERQGKRLKSLPAAVRQAPEYAEMREARELLLAQFERLRRRLEVAMVIGEVMDAQAFAPALSTPAGRLTVPRLVLRCWPRGAGEPLEILDFRTLDGRPVPIETLDRFQVAHPLRLAGHQWRGGTLAAWQRRLVAGGSPQPFNQLFREVYTPAPAEREARESRRLAGRQVRLSRLIDGLKRRGWQFGGENDLTRRLPGRVVASLGFADGAVYFAAAEVLTVDGLRFQGGGLDPVWFAARLGAVDALSFSEAMRDADLATAAAAPDRTEAPVSPEVVAVRAALARALLPQAAVDGEVARVSMGAVEGGYAVHLRSGAVYGPDGTAVALPHVPTPPAFPYPDPDPATADVIARLCHLAGERGGGAS